MNKNALSFAICLAMAIPTASNALSLGDIESKSSLNQPFQGRINLLQTNAAEVQNLKVRVASPEVFSRVGIDRPAFLNSIRFKTVVQNGRPVILVSSNQPINEPFVNFLLEVSWKNGQLLKEYTVLLDPPVLLRPDTAIASNNAGVRAEPTAQGRINRPPQMTPQQLKAQSQRQAQQSGSTFEQQARQVLQGQTQQARGVASSPVSVASNSTSSRNYRVRKGDTLSKIAGKLSQNGVTRNQMMIALFDKNRRAFSRGNINNLKAGAILSSPTNQEAKSITARAAKSQIIAQAKVWKSKSSEQLASDTTGKAPNKNNTARLEVLGKTNLTAANNSSSTGNVAELATINQQLALLTESLTTKKQENTELKSRVSELESLLRKKNRLIALKSEQLASLQSSMLVKQTNETQVQTNANALIPENVGQGIQNEVASELASKNGEIVRATPTPTLETIIVDNTPVPEPIINTEPEVVQQEKPADPFASEDTGSLDIMGLINSPVGYAAGAGSLGLLGLFALMRRRKNKVNEEFEDFSDIIDDGLIVDDNDLLDNNINDIDIDNETIFDESGYLSHDEDVTSPEETTLTADAENELDDYIQEADVYIVYGLHDQAESELKRALSIYPNSAALHAKLLENYKVAGDVGAFEDATKAFIDLEDDDKKNHWDEICEWGNALLPDSKLYDSSVLPDVAEAKATGAAMIAGKAIPASADDAGYLFTNLSGNVTPALNSTEDSDDLIEDTILDEFDELDIATDIEDFDDIDLGDSFDFDSLLDDADELSEIAGLSDDFKIDLDDDFGSIDFGNEITDKAEDTIEVSLNDSIEDSNEDTIEETDFLFDDESLDDLLNTKDSTVSDNLSLAGLVDDLDTDNLNNVSKAANLNLELGADDFNKIMPENHAYKSVSEDITDVLDADKIDLDDNLLADFDDNLSFLDLDDDNEVIGETQIETKIDLARAYIDMGDIEGVRNTLEEVMEAGNDEQKRQAEELLHQNG